MPTGRSWTVGIEPRTFWLGEEHPSNYTILRPINTNMNDETEWNWNWIPLRHGLIHSFIHEFVHICIFLDRLNISTYLYLLTDWQTWGIFRYPRSTGIQKVWCWHTHRGHYYFRSNSNNQPLLVKLGVNAFLFTNMNINILPLGPIMSVRTDFAVQWTFSNCILQNHHLQMTHGFHTNDICT